MQRSRTALAALFLSVPLVLTGCSGEGDVDVDAPNVDVTPGDLDVNAPDVEAPDVEVPDVDVDADVEGEEDADGEAGPDESPSS